MALTAATQLEIDGPRNTVSKTTGDLLGSDFPQTFTVITASSLTSMNPGMSGTFAPSLLRINCIQYSLSDDLILQLKWDATVPVLITELYGRGKIEAKQFGGLQNNAGAGVTGNITATLVYGGNTAVIATATYNFMFLLECVKFRPISVGGA